MITRWNIAKNKCKILRKLENLREYEECEESSHFLYPSQFLVLLISNFFPGFWKELKVHIVSMDDCKVEYSLK